MKKLWLTTTGIFLFQVVSGGLVYILTGDFVTAAFASVLATALLSATTHATATRPAVLTATAFLTAIVVLTTATAQTARDNGAKEPFWALWLTAIPLGVGTLCGGVLLVLRLRQDRLTFPT